MSTCPQCGAQNHGGKFCAQCGAALAQRSGPGSGVWIGVGAAVVVLLAGAAYALRLGGTSGPVAAPQPSNNSAPSSKAAKLPSDPNNPLVGGYIHIRVPGVAYTQTQGDNTKLYVSTGAMTTGSLLIFADGTYAWNSTYDSKLIHGNWVKEGDGLILKKAQEGKDWKVTLGNASSGGDIVIMDGFTWYLADRAKE